MGGIIGLMALAAVVVWLVAGGRGRSVPPPEDAANAPVDRDLLAEAERGLADDPEARPLDDGWDDDRDDWGPGAG